MNFTDGSCSIGNHRKSTVLFPVMFKIARCQPCKTISRIDPTKRAFFKTTDGIVHRKYSVVCGEVDFFPFQIAAVGENRILNLGLFDSCTVSFKPNCSVIQLNAHAVFIALVCGGVGLPFLQADNCLLISIRQNQSTVDGLHGSGSRFSVVGV